jgi:hypothetical protein
MSNDEMGDPRKYSPHGFASGAPKWSIDWWGTPERPGEPARIFTIRRSEWLGFLLIVGSLIGASANDRYHPSAWQEDRFQASNAVGATANATERMEYILPELLEKHAPSIRAGDVLLLGGLCLIYGRLGRIRDSMLGQTQRQ